MKATDLLRSVLIGSCCLLPASIRSQDAPPKPDFKWWRDGRFGMFIHWGPVSLTGKEISWSRAKSTPNSPNNGPTPADVYDKLYQQFNPVEFNADEWVSIAKATGVRYIVLTAKHCDGFLLWDSATTDYDIMNSPFKRDVVAELSTAAKKAQIPFCVYFSPADWKDPDCRNAQTNGRFVKRMHEQLSELLTRYGRIPLVWFDFDGYPNPSLPEETATLTRKLQPGVIMTNRLEALHSDESHGRFGKWGDYATPEQFVGGYCDTVPWETCMTIGTQWSWKPNDRVKSLKECLTILASTVGGDGNLLFNVGPRADGRIEPDQVTRLREMGAWLHKHGESIYGTRGGPYQPSKNYACTRNADAIFIHAFQIANDTLTLPPLPASVLSAKLLDDTPVRFIHSSDSLRLILPKEKQDPSVTVIKLSVKQAALGIPTIVPASSSGSLAYRRPVTLSSSIAPLFIHSGTSVVDDDPSTCWVSGRNEVMADDFAGKRFEHLQKLPNHPAWLHEGWMQVDLETPKDVARAILMEKNSPTIYSPVSSWKIEYEESGLWRSAAAGSTIGKSLEVKFPSPVKARKFRLSVNGPGRPAISEFQLF